MSVSSSIFVVLYGVMDIIICIPRSVPWSEYQKELDKVATGKYLLNYRVSKKPQKLNVGDRCYIIHNNILKGWMKVVGINKCSEFTCNTTGKKWSEGWYIQRTGEFHPVEPKHILSFRGYRYYKSNE